MLLPVLDPTVNPERNSNTVPLVSIVIPCYNCAEFIAEAIESALDQTHPRIEVVIVDDGSVDSSAEIISRYPVRYLSSQHEGVSAARNHGIRECLGEYVLFLDADDRLFPRAVSAGLAALEQHPECCMAVGGHNIVSHSRQLIRSCNKPLKTRDYYARLLKSNFIECTSSVLFRRDLLMLAGGFNPELHAAEDYDLYLRMARKHPICCHSDVLAEYRLHKTNSSHKSELMLTSTLRVFHSQYAYAFTSFRRSACYLYGQWFWRRKYGRQLTRELAARRTNKTADYRKQWRTLARTYPLGILIVLAIRLLPSKVAQWILQSSDSLPAMTEQNPRPALDHD